jgi:outer membrane protein OmpA-like peptidoglycan-associated protein/tetratricopeptide (TPR) repeat protein
MKKQSRYIRSGLSTLIFFLSLQILFAGNVEFTRENFPNDPRGLRQAKKDLAMGEKLFNQGGGRIYTALEFLLPAHEFNPNNARLNAMIGEIYLQTPQHEKSLEFLKQARELEKDSPGINFLLANALQLNYQFQEAIGLLRELRGSLTPLELSRMGNLIDKRIAECNSGIQLVAKPTRVFVDNAGQEINSPYDDYSPLLSPDGKNLYFTTRRPLSRNPRVDKQDFKYFENIFHATLNNKQWNLKGPVAGKINSSGHDATAAISADGKLMVIFRSSKSGRFFETILENEQWSRPRVLPKSINSRGTSTSAALSTDGNTLYFISDRPGGYGGKDIWVTSRIPGGPWSEPQNLGAVVNTEFDEEGLFLSPDNTTLYFSSKGHNTMGGFDIFKTQLQDGKWKQPVNLGYPINSPADDLFFKMAYDGKTAFLASVRPGGLGGSDIYMLSFPGPEKPFLTQPLSEPIASQARPTPEVFLDQEIKQIPPMTLLRGIVMDDETQNPLEATIELYDNEMDSLLAQFKTNPQTGAYFISLPGGKNYGIAVQAQGYLFHSENIDVVETNVFREIINNIRMKKIEVGQSIVLNNIFFDSGTARLRAESYAELGVLYKLLVDNQNIRIEISGHTDNTGSAALNQKLSEERAKTVVDYLKQRGIDPDRLSYKGYGFTRPVASNDTSEGRQKNRRTEFEIIDK